MLVLTRKEDQTLRLFAADGEITIHVGQVRGERVTLAIAAPPSVKVLRGELRLDDERGAEPATEAA